MDFFTPFADRLQAQAPLNRHTAARIGGVADWLYIARDTAGLAEVVSAAWAAGVPTTILGGGANVLISDRGIRGLVVINHVNEAEFYDTPTDDGAVCATFGGFALTVLARKCAARGLAGFEWAASVPGTVGGAAVNNAGAHGADMASNVISATVLFPDGTRTLSLADLDYGYRASSLKSRADRRFLVTGARLRLTHDDPAAITARMDANIAHRKRTQPPGASLGSIFKNPPGDYAGRLIEVCGLKGYSIGGAQVSPVHGNFFINTGKATAGDYRALVEHVHAAVLAETGVDLHAEIEMLGEW